MTPEILLGIGEIALGIGLVICATAIGSLQERLRKANL